MDFYDDADIADFATMSHMYGDPSESDISDEWEIDPETGEFPDIEYDPDIVRDMGDYPLDQF